MAKTSMYAIDRSEEYLAHYGIKGMKWGVRKAIASGGTGLGNRKLARQYKKAQKKLAKLEKRANNGAKYARRAAALGAGAAAAGGLAAAGTQGVGNAIRSVGSAAGSASRHLGSGVSKLGRAMQAAHIRGGGRVEALGKGMAKYGTKGGFAMQRGGSAVQNWGQGTNYFENAASQRMRQMAGNARRVGLESGKGILKNTGSYKQAMGATARGEMVARNLEKKADAARTGISNNQIARAGAAALGLGLAGAAGYNAYRAATTKRAAKKAAEFRKEMNKTFAGTAYGQKSSSNAGGAKKRRRR